MLVVSALAVAFTSADDWAAADALMQAYKFLPDASFSVGTVAGRVHTLEKGNLTMSTPILLASSSKYPAAIAIAGAVQDGHLSFDTPVRSVFDWWTKDPSDSRANVTLRHLMTFTSGLISLADAGSVNISCLNTSATSNASKLQPEDCAKEIYLSDLWLAKGPGMNWSYHSLHLQVAGAVAAKAAGLSVQGLLSKYLLRRVGMNSSNWVGNGGAFGDPNPHLAAALVSTGNDYDKMLHSVLSYGVVNATTAHEMERDAFTTFPNLSFGYDAKDLGLQFYGHYSMCIFLECVNQKWNEGCAQRSIHADPGAFGYWPVLNREKGYYLQLVVNRHVNPSPEVIKKYNVTAAMIAALPAQCVSPLRDELGPPVERALGIHSAPSPPAHPLPYPLDELCKIST